MWFRFSIRNYIKILCYAGLRSGCSAVFLNIFRNFSRSILVELFQQKVICARTWLWLKLEIFVRGTCEGINFSGSGFIIALYSFPKHWILLQAFVRIVPSFEKHSFYRNLHNRCFQIWLYLNFGLLNPWYSERLSFLPSVRPFLLICFWKNFRGREVLTGNNANANILYIFTYNYIFLKVNSANLKSIKRNWLEIFDELKLTTGFTLLLSFKYIKNEI